MTCHMQHIFIPQWVEPWRHTIVVVVVVVVVVCVCVCVCVCVFCVHFSATAKN